MNVICSQVDRWTSRRVPTFAYQFNDDSAPQRFAPPGALMPPIATHSSEIQYLFDQPNTPVPATLDADQERLAATMRTAWATFAARGNPATAAVAWGSFNAGSKVLALESPRPELDSSYASTHHCSFWGTA